MHTLPIQRHIRDAPQSTATLQVNLVDKLRQLMVRPLSKLDRSNTYLWYLLVIDALDEYEGENGTRIILRLLTEARSLKKVWEVLI